MALDTETDRQAGRAMTRFPHALALGRPMLWGAGLEEDVDTTLALPAGTVTFLMTDIEGSTRLWEADPEAMAQAVPIHYALLSEAIAQYGGARPGEQGEGDSILGAFARASDAVRAALEAQLALARQAWPGEITLTVRIALHTAEAQLRDEGNYFGVALSRCARLRGIANGGQTLLSRAVHDLVVEHLPEGATLVDLGSHRLRDLGRPEHVFALAHPSLPTTREPLLSLDIVANNLPDQLTSFVGREPELEQVTRMLGETRLLTLTGSGGCGKTRLAAQAGADTLEGFRDGVWWVELAPLGDGDALAQAIAQTVGVRALPGQSSLQAAIAHLEKSRVLVVLDNCEHLLDHSARAVEALLHGCHGLTVLATSRAPLGVPGETVWRVPSLSLPREIRTEPVQALAQSDAVRLFIERAIQVRPNFAVDRENAPAIAQICHDLDGIPLAIELAAARVRVLGVEQIAAGLGDRFRLLTGGARSAMARQQTLRASVDWSHELLGDDERTLLRRLAVFAGGWTLDAVERVCTGAGLERLAILDVLTALVDKSLVTVDERGTSMRYRLLETVRQYALDRLHEAGEGDELRDRHLETYLAIAERIAPQLHVAEQPAWLEVLDLEAGNFAVALDRAVEADGELALRLCIALTFWFKLRGSFAKADAAYVRALDAPGSAHSALRARVLWARGYLLVYGGRYEEAVASASDALARANETGDISTAARALDVLGTVYMFPDPAGARPGLEQARELALEAGDDWCFVDATQILASTLVMQADPEAAGVWEEAFAVLERNGYAECEAWHWWGLGSVRQLQGRDDEALELFARAIERADAVGEPVSSGVTHASRTLTRCDHGAADEALAELGSVTERSIAAGAGLAIPWLELSTFTARAAVGDLEQTRASLSEYVSSGASGGPYGTVIALTLLGRIDLSLGEFDGAGGHAQAAIEIADGKLGNPFYGAAARTQLAAVALAGGSPAEAERLAHEALATAVEQGYRPLVAPVLDVLAVTAASLESLEESSRIAGAAQRAFDQLGHVRWEREQAAVDALAAQLRSALDEDGYDRAWAAGHALETDAAISWLRRARGARKRPAGGWESLTPTELQVVELAAQGLTNPEIARRMFISRGTVKVHLSHVYAKLSLRNRSELATRAAQRPAE
jgi:predicted ATPase/class 3 adenylate cyclase/DNA-binding CsgD family transcriptional regulator